MQVYFLDDKLRLGLILTKNTLLLFEIISRVGEQLNLELDHFLVMFLLPNLGLCNLLILDSIGDTVADPKGTAAPL